MLNRWVFLPSFGVWPIAILKSWKEYSAVWGRELLTNNKFFSRMNIKVFASLCQVSNVSSFFAPVPFHRKILASSKPSVAWWVCLWSLLKALTSNGWRSVPLYKLFFINYVPFSHGIHCYTLQPTCSPHCPAIQWHHDSLATSMEWRKHMPLWHRDKVVAGLLQFILV